MAEFEETRWANRDFSRNYIDKANLYIVERVRMFDIVKSLFLNFGTHNAAILDLGCGDGILSQILIGTGKTSSVTLLDGSPDMLQKARERLKGYDNTTFVTASFQQLLNEENIANGGTGGKPIDSISGEVNGKISNAIGNTIWGKTESYGITKIDFVVSSLSIHHLPMDEKRSLFKMIYHLLNDGGYFVNVDVVRSPSGLLDEWYMALWKEWMMEKQAAMPDNMPLKREPVEDIILRYKDGKENQPDTLDEQLASLRDCGFLDVDCYYKYGVFVVFGGRK